MDRFLQSYYVVNTLAILSYLPVRLLVIEGSTSLGNPKPENYVEVQDEGLMQLDAYFGMPREFEILVTLVLYLAVQYKRSKSLEAFMSTVIIYSKFAVLLMAYFAGRTVFIWYLIFFALITLLLQSPTFPWSENVEEMDFEEIKTLEYESSSNKTGKGKKKSTLVFCGVEGHRSCAEFVPTFSKLAEKHSSEFLTFSRLDLGDNEEAAKTLRIDTAFESIQLPSMILYEGGKEQRRLPPFDTDGNPVNATYEIEGVEAFFSLTERSLGVAPKNTEKKKSK